jgi:hypothetical protein
MRRCICRSNPRWRPRSDYPGFAASRPMERLPDVPRGPERDWCIVSSRPARRQILSRLATAINRSGIERTVPLGTVGKGRATHGDRNVPSPGTGWLPARLPVQADYACAAPGTAARLGSCPGSRAPEAVRPTGTASLEGFRPSHPKSGRRGTLKIVATKSNLRILTLYITQLFLVSTFRLRPFVV